MQSYVTYKMALLLSVPCLGAPATPPPPQQGLLVSGGYRIQDTWADSRLTVELLYGNGSSCWLPSLPEGRWSHSQSGLVICGGGAGEETRGSCSALVAGAWLPSHTLQVQRWNHLSWETEGGILLLGGWDSGAGRTTELLSPTSSTTTEKFVLPYETRYGRRRKNKTILYVAYCRQGCSISVPNMDRLVVTGGRASTSGYAGLARVQEYSAQGATTQLPDLTQPRYDHGCAHYYDNTYQLVRHLTC